MAAEAATVVADAAAMAATVEAAVLCNGSVVCAVAAVELFGSESAGRDAVLPLPPSWPLPPLPLFRLSALPTDELVAGSDSKSTIDVVFESRSSPSSPASPLEIRE